MSLLIHLRSLSLFSLAKSSVSINLVLSVIRIQYVPLKIFYALNIANQYPFYIVKVGLSAPYSNWKPARFIILFPARVSWLGAGAMDPQIFEIVGVLEILIFRRKIFRVLLLLRIKVSNFIGKSLILAPSTLQVPCRLWFLVFTSSTKQLLYILFLMYTFC